MSENTRFEEYEQKTRRIILVIGIIAGLLFLFGLIILSSDDETYNPEEEAPEYKENQDGLPDLDNGEDALLLMLKKNRAQKAKSR